MGKVIPLLRACAKSLAALLGPLRLMPMSRSDTLSSEAAAEEKEQDE
jgi:hypothetical protein